MKKTEQRMRQLVDWSAAVWAGLASGVIFFLLNVFITPFAIGGNAWVIVRLFASVTMGEEILAPPATFHLSALIAAFLTNMIISLLLALLIAYVIHRGGLITGILGGAVLGLAIYGINFYTVTYKFPWLFVLRGWMSIVNHVLFGAMAGGMAYRGV